jgi:hypothetical protein
MGQLGGRTVKNPMVVDAPKLNNPVGGAKTKSPIVVPNKLRRK